MDTETLRHLCDAADALLMAVDATVDAAAEDAICAALDAVQDAMLEAVAPDDGSEAHEPCPECGG